MSPYYADGAMQSFNAPARTYTVDTLGQLTQVKDGSSTRATYTYDATGRVAKIVAQAAGQTSATTRHLVTEDFEWNETAGQARIHVSLAGQTIAIRTVTWSPPTGGGGGGCAAAPGALPLPGGGTGKGVFEWLYPCAGALALLLALRALQRRRRGESVAIALGWRPGIAAATGIAFVAVFVVPEALRVQQAEAFVAGEIVFFHGDHLGSAVVTTNGAGALIDRVLYRPYGSRIPASGQTNAPEVGFTGQRFEAATQLYDYGARFYDPAMGRFLQPDPIVSDVYTPQTMNAYAYALGSPVNFVDPTGMQAADPDPYGGAFDWGMPGEPVGEFSQDAGWDGLPMSTPWDASAGGSLNLGPSDLLGSSVGRMIAFQGQENVSRYDTSLGTLFQHYVSRQGGVVELPLSDIDTGIGPAQFPSFRKEMVNASAGASTGISLRYQYDQGRLRAGQVSLQLRGVIERGLGGKPRFFGTIRGVAQDYNFERRATGERTTVNELLTTIGRNIPGVPFRVQYVGERPVTYPRRRRRFAPRRIRRHHNFRVALVLLLALACSRNEPIWFIDGQFSDALTIDARQSRLTTGFDGTSAVMVLQVYKSSQADSDLMDVDRIRALPLVLELREPLQITEYLRAAQQTELDSECNLDDSQSVLHFLAFDPLLQRVGYFRYYPCVGGKTGEIVSSGGWSVFYSSALASLVGKIEK